MCSLSHYNIGQKDDDGRDDRSKIVLFAISKPERKPFIAVHKKRGHCGSCGTTLKINAKQSANKKSIRKEE